MPVLVTLIVALPFFRVGVTEVIVSASKSASVSLANTSMGKAITAAPLNTMSSNATGGLFTGAASSGAVPQSGKMSNAASFVNLTWFAPLESIE